MSIDSRNAVGSRRRTERRRVSYAWKYSWLLLILGGCWPDDRPRLVPLQGRVVHQGQGVTAGSVYFHPAATAEYTKDTPSSLLQSDGSFTAKTFPSGEGIAPGQYTVTLAPELAQRLKQPKYGSASQSPWQLTVPVEGNTAVVLEIE